MVKRTGIYTRLVDLDLDWGRLSPLTTDAACDVLDIAAAPLTWQPPNSYNDLDLHSEQATLTFIIVTSWLPPLRRCYGNRNDGNW